MPGKATSTDSYALGTTEGLSVGVDAFFVVSRQIIPLFKQIRKN